MSCICAFVLYLFGALQPLRIKLSKVAVGGKMRWCVIEVQPERVSQVYLRRQRHVDIGASTMWGNSKLFEPPSHDEVLDKTLLHGMMCLFMLSIKERGSEISNSYHRMHLP